VITLLIAYLVLEWASFIHEHKGIPVTPWNPALGLLFAVMLLKGSGYGLVLFAGVVIAEVFLVRTELPWVFGGPVGLGLEEDYLVTATGSEPLGKPQETLILIPSPAAP